MQIFSKKRVIFKNQRNAEVLKKSGTVPAKSFNFFVELSVITTVVCYICKQTIVANHKKKPNLSGV